MPTDTPAQSPLVAQILSTNAQRDSEEDQQHAQSAAYGGRGTYGGGQFYGGDTGYDPSVAPGYGVPGGVLPKRDFGFEEFQSHHLGNVTTGTNGLIAHGPYQGLTKGQAIEKMRDDYAAMSPEERAPWEAKRFYQDVRSPEEQKDQGFQYSDQTDKWGDKSAPNMPFGGQNIPSTGTPSSQPFKPGSINDDVLSGFGHALDGSQPFQSNVVTHPDNMIVPPAGGMAAGKDGGVIDPAYGLARAQSTGASAATPFQPRSTPNMTLRAPMVNQPTATAQAQPFQGNSQPPITYVPPPQSKQTMPPGYTGRSSAIDASIPAPPPAFAGVQK